MSKPAGESGIAARCRKLAEPVAAELSLSLWDVRFVKEGACWYLRYLIDREGGVTVNECAEMCRRLNPLLDEADPIPQSYCLEVMSPGIERELTRPEHFEQCRGCAVVIRRIRPDEAGQREVAGILEQRTEDGVTVTTEDGGTLTVPKKEIAAVHLIDDWEDNGADTE